MRALLIPLALLAEAIGGVYWLVYGFWWGSDAQDRARSKYLFGWLDPALYDAWRQLETSFGYESLKNLVSEYTRLDPQRAAKLGLAGWLITTVILASLIRF